MFITNTINKKLLETIIHESFLQFGNISSSSLLDSLKLLGFYYATNSGLSINIEDLKTPYSKTEILEDVSVEIQEVSFLWESGLISDIERFQTIIDSWNMATESLKNKIVSYYKTYDPLNNLYVMAFSGARGNMSQVRQLVGIRGLMSDQEGNIIDLPIQTNFREGLSSIDYIISSYGARKGVVDTALKTADAGYLTRRLIYLAQDLIIREIDCKTKNGIIFLLNEKTNTKNLIGRVLINVTNVIYSNKNNFVTYNNHLLDDRSLQKLKEYSPIALNLRSPLSCESNGSICQKCYGWDLAHNKVISLGETVGIIAAQSIGEPGTQLTMRTFHTGGIFTSELLQQTIASFSGKLILPKSLKANFYRNNHGIYVLKLQQETIITLIDWKGKKEEIFLLIGSYLYVTESSFLKKGQLIAEYSTKAVLASNRRLKPIYTQMDAEVKFQNVFLRTIQRFGSEKLRVNEDDGMLWLLAGKICPIPQETDIKFSQNLQKRKSFGKLKLVTPISGIVELFKNYLTITNKKEKKSLKFSLIKRKKQNHYETEIVPLVKNYQFIDAHTILAFFYLFPNYNEKLYVIRKKEIPSFNFLFLITESDVWKMNSDQMQNIDQSKIIVRAGGEINETSILGKSGILLKNDGFRLIFQKAMPIFLTRGTLLNFTAGNFVFQNQILATLVNYRQQTEDIVQGLPKIEEIIEARAPKVKAVLAIEPGIFIQDKKIEILKEKYFEKNNETICLIPSKLTFFSSKKKKIKKDEDLQLWQILRCASFKSEKPNVRLYLERLLNPTGKQKENKLGLPNLNFFYPDGSKLIKSNIYCQNYKIPLGMKCITKVGEFLDLGEPITDGLIDPHELLEIFYNYHLKLDGNILGTIRSLTKFQLVVINSILAIYSSQGVNISSKHIEIIVRQMTSKVLVQESGTTPLIQGEYIRVSLMLELLKTLSIHGKNIISPKFTPIFMSSTNSALNKDGFLSSSGFQETKRVLTKAAMEGTVDWLRGLKECIIIGRLIPAGSSFLNYKNYLDNIYYYKEIKKEN